MRTRTAQVAALTAATATLIAAGVAAAAPTAANLTLLVGASTSPRPPLVARGATVTVSSLRFWVAAVMDNVGPDQVALRMRFELGPGLRWGEGDPPDPSEGCTTTDSTADCAPDRPLSAAEGFGWVWDVVAARPGSYTIRAEIFSTSTPDPDPSDNSASINIVVAPPAARTTASALTLSPRRPRAGATLSARATVRREGQPLTPTSLRCAGRIGGVSISGTPRAQSGAAVCRYRTRAAHRGKTLRGTVSFTAGDATFTRRFSVRLR